MSERPGSDGALIILLSYFQALELIERRYGTMAHLFSAEPEDLDTSRSDESEDWPDNDDVMTEIKK